VPALLSLAVRGELPLTSTLELDEHMSMPALDALVGKHKHAAAAAAAANGRLEVGTLGSVVSTALHAPESGVTFESDTLLLQLHEGSTSTQSEPPRKLVDLLGHLATNGAPSIRQAGQLGASSAPAVGTQSCECRNSAQSYECGEFGSIGEAAPQPPPFEFGEFGILAGGSVVGGLASDVASCSCSPAAHANADGVGGVAHCAVGVAVPAPVVAPQPAVMDPTHPFVRWPIDSGAELDQDEAAVSGRGGYTASTRVAASNGDGSFEGMLTTAELAGRWGAWMAWYPPCCCCVTGFELVAAGPHTLHESNSWLSVGAYSLAGGGRATLERVPATNTFRGSLTASNAGRLGTLDVPITFASSREASRGFFHTLTRSS
jgi:hypothetical protein